MFGLGEGSDHLPHVAVVVNELSDARALTKELVAVFPGAQLERVVVDRLARGRPALLSAKRDLAWARIRSR